MPLSQSQAIMLGALSGLEPTQALTVRELATRLDRSPRSVRDVVASLAVIGLTSRSQRPPFHWRITARGRLALRAPGYREYLPGYRECLSEVR
ncbi:hypothetical protein [Nocardia australiensis]|uniref:hypothetical protein n=1 Tax=Nocardia australiensis TaxID=2887191 RepID=UPI001D14E500|nr:hypothetical protein [Nocardia australiensis]